MLRFPRLRCQHQFRPRLVRWDYLLTLMCIWLQSVWSDGTSMFRFRIHRKHGDDENMHVKIYDKHGDTPIPICQPMHLLLKFCKKRQIEHIFQRNCKYFHWFCYFGVTCLENICNYLVSKLHRPEYGVYNRLQGIL